MNCQSANYWLFRNDVIADWTSNLLGLKNVKNSHCKLLFP